MKRIGIFVGVDQYDLAPLSSAVNDAKEICYAFQNEGFDVTLLQNKNATAENIEKTIKQVIAKLGKEDIFVFYFAGHGHEYEGRRCIVDVRNKSLAYHSLREVTNSVIRLHRLFIFDCCRMEGASRNFYRITENKINDNKEKPGNKCGIIPPYIISSCSSGEVSLEDNLHGLFTKELLKAIKDKNINSFDMLISRLQDVSAGNATVNFDGNPKHFIKKTIFKSWQPESIYEEMEFSKLEMFANHGDADAQYELGVRFECGDEVEENPIKAFYWFSKAAAQGHPQAQYDLGYFYENGIGVSANSIQAFNLYFQASAQGHSEAQCTLGYCYENGIGVSVNPTKAFHWYMKAAQNDEEFAMVCLGRCFDCGYGTEKNAEKALYWYERAAMMGNKEALFQKAIFYKYGYGTGQNTAWAFQYFLEEATQGNCDAMIELADCFEQGYGAEKNLLYAVSWYKKAAIKGNADAQYRLGCCYETEYRNLKEAKFWYKKAAAQGSVEAQERLKIVK